MSTFTPIPSNEWINGQRARSGRWTVDVIRAYPGEWNVFVRLDGQTQQVDTLPLSERLRQAIYASRSYSPAMRLGRQVLAELPPS